MSLARARHDVVLLAPGAFADRLGGPMTPNLAHLRALGLEARRADFSSGARMEVAADAIAGEIRELAGRGRRAILVGHSSGAVAITVALARSSELAAHVRCAVLLQTTYLGSPVADAVARLRATPARRLVERIVDGDFQAIVDVTTPVRRAFVEAHPYPAHLVPTVALATRRLSPRSPLFPLQLLLRLARAGASDGMVPTAHQHVPGALVVEERLDHAQPVIGARAGELTERLLVRALALELEGRVGHVA